jgi:O-antigen/teichoic acid export membrane protein
MSGGLSSQIITNSNYYRYNGFFVIIYLALNVILNIILIQILGIAGAALAAFLSALVFNILKFLFIYRKFSIQPYHFNHIKILAICTAAYLIVVVFDYPENLIINILIKSSFFGVLFLLMNYFLRTSSEYVAIADKLLERFWKK